MVLSVQLKVEMKKKKTIRQITITSVFNLTIRRKLAEKNKL